MDLKARLVQRLESAEDSLRLIHIVVQNWIVFQRDSFDVFDEDGDPFTTQTFLIELSSGKYIHRAQGQKVDFGSTLDADTLYGKITEAFVESRVCQGYSFSSQLGNETDLCFQEYPYKRRASPQCQILFTPNEKAISLPDEEAPRWVCPDCQESWSNESYWESLLVNQPQLKAVLNEPIELFPPAKEETFVEDQEDSRCNLQSDGEEEENEGDLSPKTQKVTQISLKRKINDDREDVKDQRAQKAIFCGHCSETFPSPAAYQLHQRKKRQLTCKECDTTKITFKQLLGHVYKCHPRVLGKYILQVQNPEELKSMKVPRKCSLCDMICNGSVLLFRHRELYHELGDYKCPTCREPCLTYYDLTIHTYQKHDQAMKQIQPQTHGLKAVISLEDGKIEYKRESFACQYCPSSFTHDPGWTLHMRQKHSWGLFECKTCDETCHFAADFSAHMLAFHPENPEIKCPNEQCSHVSNLSQDPKEFNLHYEICEPTTKAGKYIKQEFQCETCGKKFATRSAFDAHVNLHQGIERFKCSFCEFGTNTKSILIDHEKCHLRDKGLTNADTNLILYHHCDQCEKQYSTRHALKDHIKSVHKGMPIVKRCKDCEKTFHSSSALYFHKRKVHGFVNTQEKRISKRKKTI